MFQAGKTAKVEYRVDLKGNSPKGTTGGGRTVIKISFNEDGTIKGQEGYIASSCLGLERFSTKLISQENRTIQFGEDENNLVKFSEDYQCITIKGNSHCGPETVNFIGFELATDNHEL